MRYSGFDSLPVLSYKGLMEDKLKEALAQQYNARLAYNNYLTVKLAENDNHGIWDIAVELYKLDYTIRILESLRN